MKAPQPSRPARSAAFTLVEMLVVIGIIAILAAMIFPAMTYVKKRSVLNKAQAELKLVEMAIDSYKEKYNSYPPGNPGQPALNQLYFELAGTELINPDPNDPVYRTLDGRVQSIKASQIKAIFGPNVNGFQNVTRDKSGDVPVAQNFIKGFHGTEVGDYSSGGTQAKLLVCSVGWLDKSTRPVADPTPDPGPYLNPWRYVSSGATNNTSSYDLWVDVVISGKLYRISNFSDRPQEF